MPTAHPSSARSEGSGARLARIRWVMWAPPALLYFGIIFERSTAAAIADRLMAEFGVGAGVLGLLTGIQFFTYLLMQVPCGTLADLVGPRRLLAVGGSLAGVGTLVFGSAPSFPLAVAGRCIYSLGDSLIFLSVLRLQAEWFRPREYATLVGVTGFTGGLGAILATAPLALAVNALGWRPPLVASGVALLVVACVVWVVVRDRPSDCGLPSWPEVELGSQWRAAIEGPQPAVVPEGVGPEREAAPRPTGRAEAGEVWRQLAANLRVVGGNAQTYCALLSHFSLFGPYLVFTTTWGIPYLMQAHGLGRAAAGQGVALAAIGSLLGGPVMGWLSDRLGQRRRIILVSQGAMIGVWLGLMLPVTLPLEVLDPLVFAVGFFTSGNLLSFAAAKDANAPAVSGLATGFTNLGGFLCGALLPPLFGLVLDLRWQGQFHAGARLYPPSAFELAFGLMLMTTLIGMTGTLRLRERVASQT